MAKAEKAGRIDREKQPKREDSSIDEKKKEAKKREQWQEEMSSIKEAILAWFNIGRKKSKDNQKAKGEVKKQIGRAIGSLTKASKNERVSLNQVDREISQLERIEKRDQEAEERLSLLRRVREGVSETVAEAVMAVSDEQPLVTEAIKDNAEVLRDPGKKPDEQADSYRLIEKAFPRELRSEEVIIEVAKEIEKPREGKVNLGKALREIKQLKREEQIIALEAKIVETRKELRAFVERKVQESGLPEEVAERVTKKVVEVFENAGNGKMTLEELENWVIAGGELGGEEIATGVVPAVREAVLRLGTIKALRQNLVNRETDEKELKTPIKNLAQEEKGAVGETLELALRLMGIENEEKRLEKEEEEAEEKKAEYRIKIHTSLGAEAAKFNSFQQVNFHYEDLILAERRAEKIVDEQRRTEPSGNPSSAAESEYDQAKKEREKFERDILQKWRQVAGEELREEVKVVDRAIGRSSLDLLKDKREQAIEAGDLIAAHSYSGRIEDELREIGRRVGLVELSSEEKKVFEGYLEYYFRQKTAPYLTASESEIPETVNEQLEWLQDKIRDLMRSGESLDVLYYSTRWADLIRQLTSPKVKEEVLGQYQAISSVIMKFGRTIGHPLDLALEAASYLTNSKIATLLVDNDRLALAYDILEDSAQGRLELASGLTILGANTPEDRDKIKDELKNEWAIRMAGGKPEFKKMNREKKDELLTEANSFLTQARPLWDHMALGRYDTPQTKDNWLVQRLLNYNKRLMDSGVGNPNVVDRVTGRKFVQIWNDEKKEFVDYGFRLGLAGQQYYEYITYDAINTTGLDKFQKETGFSFVKDKNGERVRRRVKITDREVVMNDKEGHPIGPGSYLMRHSDGMEILLTTKWSGKKGEEKERVAAVIAVFDPTAKLLGRIHRYSKDSRAAGWVQSHLRHLETSRRTLEDKNGFFSSPMGAELGTFGLESEPSKTALRLKENVANHLPEIETEKKKAEGRGEEWRRTPGVFYREDYFKEMCSGLLELAGSREGRSRYEAYALAPWNRKAVILTAFGRARLITSEMEAELERKYFGPRLGRIRPRTILARADIYLAVFRIRNLRTMIVLDTVGNFFKTLFNYVFGAAR